MKNENFDNGKISRRTALFTISNLLTAFSVYFGREPRPGDSEHDKAIKEFGEKIRGQVTKEIQRDGYLNTIGESTLYVIGELIFFDFLSNNTNIKFGNANAKHSEESFLKMPVDTMFNSIINTPFLEEFAFRLVPSLLADKYLGEGMHFFKVGVPVSLLFGYLHNFDMSEVKWDTKHIPLPQILGGIFLWYLMRKTKGGITHAVLSHSMMNASCYIAHFLDKVYSKKSKI
jgi:hypothetical protein